MAYEGVKQVYKVICCYLLFSGYAVAHGLEGSSAVEALAQRLLGERAAEFAFQLKEAKRDVFEIEASKGKVVITGNSKIALTSGLHWYLKHHCHCHVSWNGDQLHLPQVLPDARERRSSPYKHGFYFNYCTYSYTMPWWDWDRWQREIDYMALCGIDMPLAITGSEALWLNFLKRFGYSHEDAKAYICGPAYNAWWLMGNLEGRGGPVSDQWIASRVDLQKKILKRMRELGMRPALPGFVGLVPNNLAERVEAAKILPQGRWAGPNLRPAVLNPDLPLFDQMAKAWYEEQEKLYGHWDVFAGDLFHEGGKTHGMDVAKIAKKVQGHMIDHDPNAVWVIQGWGHNPTKSLLAPLKKENTLVLELCNEFWRNWEKKDSFWGMPWTFSTIIMYGGNTAMHGRLNNIASNLKAALESSNPPQALGATWESIEINPVVMDYLWDMRWRNEVVEPAQWLKGYAERRYGGQYPNLEKAWSKLLTTGYGAHPGLRRPQESIFCARPGMNVKKASPFAATIKVHYDQCDMLEVGRLMLSVADKVGGQETYQYDLVDVSRQFLSNAGQVAYHRMVDAYKVRDLKNFEKFSSYFLEMLEDQDRLLATQKAFMLGPWLDSARNIAPTPSQQKQNEHAARMLISTWTEESTILDNYSWREWHGMLGRYYHPQWKMFINDLRLKLKGGKTKPINYYAFRKNWAAQVWGDDSYPIEPVGDPIVQARRILKKWGPWLEQHYHSPVVAGRADFVGSWEYQAVGATWRRTLHKDGKLTLQKNSRQWTAWKGFTWKYKANIVIFYRADGTQFGTMKMTEPSRAHFSEGYQARRLETGKNTEADEISE